jgi:hypothetical protein
MATGYCNGKVSMKIQITVQPLSSGRPGKLTLKCNRFGQVRLKDLVDRGLAMDETEAAKMLDVAPCNVRYGLVVPGARSRLPA